jgi:hypothetical protein
MKHESKGAEYFALASHFVWAAVCLLGALNYLQCAIEDWQFTVLNGVLGFIMKRLFWHAIVQQFFCAFGFLWHVWGTREHFIALRKF